MSVDRTQARPTATYEGAAHTPGTKEDMDAYRAEIFGIYCLLICIKYICIHENITDG